MGNRAKRWVLIVHGGAKTIALSEEVAHRSGCLAAVEAGAAILRGGGNAVQAVVAAVMVLENNPTFNAGTGAVRNADGNIELDAAIMDGATLDVGAVAAVRDLRHPIEAALALLREAPVLLVGSGAQQFAAAQGLAPAIDGSMLSASSGHDTVGCVAMDMAGHVAAATSTGGLTGTLPGRVGDSPLPGCGLYADDHVGAVALSGDGEAIVRSMLAARVMMYLDGLTSQAAVQQAITWLGRIGGEAGAIAIDADGRPGVAHNSSHFALAIAAADIAATAGVSAAELEHLPYA